MGLVTLYACDDNSRRFVLAEGLAGLSNRLAAAQRCVLVAGADKAGFFVRRKVGIERDDRLVRRRNKGGGRSRLLRRDHDRINARIAERGFDHVDLLVIRRCRRR